MADVKQTAARMAMLRLIEDGKIRRDINASFRRYEHKDTRLTLTARTANVIDAKWAREENYAVVLTVRGRSVLTEWEKSRNET